MVRYHINNDGNARPCSANVGRCHFGSIDEHYPSLMEAQAAVEQKYSGQHNPLLGRRKMSKREILQTKIRQLQEPLESVAIRSGAPDLPLPYEISYSENFDWEILHRVLKSDRLENRKILSQLRQQMIDNYAFLGSGNEQMAFISHDSRYIYKIPNEYKDTIDSACGSMVHHGLVAEFESTSERWKISVPTKLIQHSSGYPILVQERLTEVYNWGNKVPSDVPSWYETSDQIGKTADGHWCVYDYDGLSPVGEPAGSLAEVQFYELSRSLDPLNRLPIIDDDAMEDYNQSLQEYQKELVLL